MRLEPTGVPGVVVVELDRIEDERGFFARSFDRAAFAEAGLEPVVEQCNVSWNARAGTLRGLHLQAGEHAEAKLVRCTRGAVVDVAVDLRPGSATRLQSVMVRLDAASHRALYVPPGFAHGFQTLEDDTELTYQASRAYAPGAELGARWDDPALGLAWPLPVSSLSDKDRTWPLLDPA